MTQQPPSQILAFVAGVRRLSPTLVIDLDPPSPETASSHWIDVRIDDVFLTVEWNPRLGFGFSDEEIETSSLYGTPSKHFISNTDDAVAFFNRLILAHRTPARENPGLARDRRLML